MAIKMSRYVRIISSVTGATAVAEQKLTGRRFTTDPRVPVGKIVSVSPGGADDYFGASSPEAAFARQYFSYISPAPASQAPELQFAAYASTARAARIYGYKISKTLAEFQAVNAGNLNVTIAGNQYNIAAIDLSGATSFTDVTNIINGDITTAVGGGTGASVSFDPLSSTFTIVSSATGADTLLVDVATGSDLGAFMKLQGAQAINSPGVLTQTPLVAFQTAEQVTDSFGSVSWGTPVALIDAIPVAEYVSGENVKYQAYWSVDSITADDWFAAMENTASNGLILNTVSGEYKESLPQAIMAATDYDRINAAINYMFRQTGVTFTPDVTTDQMADFYDVRRVNYYGQTASAGKNIAFFQRGYLMGGATAPLDMSVHANEQWFKAYLKSQLMSMLLAIGRIPANLDGRGMILAVVQGGINKALRNGTIIVGKTLTELQKVAISQGSGDTLAFQDVQTNGYWMDAEVTQSTGASGVTEYAVKYTVFYSKGDSIRKIAGSHNLI